MLPLLATERLRLEPVALGDLDRLYRLVALAAEPNARSRRLLARLGFRSIGTGRRPEHPLWAYSLALPKRRLDRAGAYG